MAETVHQFHDANLSARRKHNVEQDLAFNLELTPFVGVYRTRLEGDLHRQSFDGGLRRFGFGLRCRNHIGVSEAGLANRAARARYSSTVARGHAAAKTCARDHSTSAMRSAGTVAGAGAGRHVK